MSGKSPKYQRRHYEDTARIINTHLHRKATNTDGARAIRYLAQAFALQYSVDNPRFNEARFLEACGVQ
jgi:hypothetical protein